MDNIDLKFAEWVAEKITIEKLEYDFSDEIWFYENSSGEFIQYNTKGIYQVYMIEANFYLSKRMHLWKR